MSSRSRHVRPQCLALVLCETVIEDVRTRNKSLIHLFSGILGPAAPVRHDRMSVFAAFAGGRGDVPIWLRLCEDAAYETDLLRLGGDVRFPPDDPQAVVEIVWDIRGFQFPRFGRYSFEVVCDDVPLMARRFTVTEAPPLPAQPAPPDPQGGSD